MRSIVRNMWKYLIIISILVMEMQSESCSLPKVEVTEEYYQKPNPHFKIYDGFYSLEMPDYPEGFYQYGKSGRIIDMPREPDDDGFYTFQSKDPMICLKCTSNEFIDFIYTAEEINVLDIFSEIRISVFEPYYNIKSQIRFNNGSGFGQFYCSNDCGSIVISLKSHNGFSTFKKTHLQKVIIAPPLPNVTYNKSEACPTRITVQIDYVNFILRAKCIDNDIPESVFDAEFKAFQSPIDLAANMRKGILPDICINHITAEEECEHCIPFKKFQFQPTLISCFNSTAKHFVFFPLDSFYTNTTPTNTKYHSWSDADFKRMMHISIPRKINSKWFNYVKCESSSILFIPDPFLRLGTRNNGSNIWNETNSFENFEEGVHLNEEDNYSIVMPFPLPDVDELNKVVEVKCRARVWNSTKLIEITKLIHYELATPKFDKKQEIIPFSNNANLTVDCSVKSDLFLSFRWILPIHNIVPPMVDSGSDSSTLSFYSIDESYSGSYFCVAKNAYGESVKEFILRHADPVKPKNYSATLTIITILTIIALLTGLFLSIWMRKKRKLVNDTPESIAPPIHDDSPRHNSNIALEEINEQLFKVWNSTQPWLKLSTPLSIGRGSFTVVYKVFNVILNEEFALKKMSLNKGSKTTLNEIRNLSLINDPHVVRLIHCWTEDENEQLEELEHKFQESLSVSVPRYLFIIMELCDLTLKNWMSDKTEFKDRKDHISKLTHDCISGLSALHMKNIIHGNIKPNNIFLIVDSSGNPQIWKLGDFGQLATNSGIDEESDGRDWCRCPEIWNEGCENTMKTDVYSLGVTFLEAVHSFPGVIRDELVIVLKEHSAGCLHEIPESRPFLNQYCHKVCELIKAMLRMEPEKRMDITGQISNILKRF